MPEEKSTTTSTTEREQLLRLLPRRRLLPLRPEDIDVEPEDPLSDV